MEIKSNVYLQISVLISQSKSNAILNLQYAGSYKYRLIGLTDNRPTPFIARSRLSAGFPYLLMLKSNLSFLILYYFYLHLHLEKFPGMTRLAQYVVELRQCNVSLRTSSMDLIVRL